MSSFSRFAARRGREYGRDVLIVERVGSVGDFGEALAAQLFDGASAHRPAPRNLDALADILREFHITRVTSTFWTMPTKETYKVEAMLADVGVVLVR